MAIIIANHSVLEGIGRYRWHPMLTRLANWCAHRYSNFRITCAWEHRDYASVHGTNPLRGLDIGVKKYADPKLVEQDINQCWEYDSARQRYKCARYHAVCPKCHADHAEYSDVCECGENIKNHWHIHLQVHDRTRIVNSPTCKIGGA